jgi:hypothetical protein
LHPLNTYNGKLNKKSKIHIGWNSRISLPPKRPHKNRLGFSLCYDRYENSISLRSSLLAEWTRWVYCNSIKSLPDSQSHRLGSLHFSNSQRLPLHHCGCSKHAKRASWYLECKPKKMFEFPHGRVTGLSNTFYWKDDFVKEEWRK